MRRGRGIILKMFEIQTGKIMVYINFQEVVKDSETLCTM